MAGCGVDKGRFLRVFFDVNAPTWARWATEGIAPHRKSRVLAIANGEISAAELSRLRQAADESRATHKYGAHPFSAPIVNHGDGLLGEMQSALGTLFADHFEERRLIARSFFEWESLERRRPGAALEALRAIPGPSPPKEERDVSSGDH